MHQRPEVLAEVVRPNQDCEDPFPKRQLEKADREQPGTAPEGARASVLLDANLFHRILL